MIRPNATTAAKLLILDADRILRNALSDSLARDGYEVRTTAALSDALESAADADVVIADLDAVGGRAVEAMKEITRRAPHTGVIVLSGFGSVETAKELIRVGAADYLTKPVSDEHLKTAIARLLRRQALHADERPRASSASDGLEDLIGRDAKMRKVFDTAVAVADSRASVLILGESGTGKSMLARAIHARSPRHAKAFVEVACGSLLDTLLESELFGHVAGAFTGAMTDKAGRFVTADGGTLFLDEINSAPPPMQVKLLRVLQERRLEPVGSDATKQVDVRTVLASNADLGAMVAAGTFRQDLFYRINVVTLHLPPLRERAGDVPLLAESFLRKFSEESGRRVVGLTAAALRRLGEHAWPGNVRELENAIERAVVLCRRPTIDADDLPDTVGVARPANPAIGQDLPALPLDASLDGFERRVLEAALNRNGWNRNATAAELAIDRTTLYKKMRKHGLEIAHRN